MIRIQTLATCHNRKEKTLKALEALYNQELPPDVQMTHLLVDDGSNDGTYEEVKQRFPGVEVLRGNGSLFWAGGMRLGWGKIEEACNEFEYLFVYNDDSFLYSDALKEFFESAVLAKNECEKFVIVGAYAEPNKKHITHGGRRKISKVDPFRLRKISPDGSLMRMDTLNMNGAMIPSKVLKEMGFLADYFIHNGADTEYGLRITKQGGCIFQTRRFVGVCGLNSKKNTSLDKDQRFICRVKHLLGPKEEPVHQRYMLCREHGGIFWLLVFIKPYLFFVAREIKNVFISQK